MISDGNVRAELVEPGLRNAVDCEEIINPSEWAASFAEPYDCLSGGRADARELLQLLDGRCVQVEWLRGRLLLLACGKGAYCEQHAGYRE